MFACLFQPSSQFTLFGPAARAADAAPAVPAAVPGDGASGPLDALAREFSPRVQVHRDSLVSLDIGGLGRLLGTPAEIGEELKRAAEDRGLSPHVAVAPTRTAALLLALSRPGVTVVPPGGERQAVATLPLGVLRQYPRELFGADDQCQPAIDLLRRWGLRTLGDLAELPARPLSERLGQDGVAWRRLARGEDLQPLVATEAAAPIEEALDLEWPVEGLEPLSFVLARVCEPLSERLAAQDLAAVVLHLSCRLVSRETETRDLQLPAPMRDPKVLRTLLLLHLESHPLAAGVDRLALRVDVAPARITQFSLLARARPFPEQMATLLARLSALARREPRRRRRAGRFPPPRRVRHDALHGLEPRRDRIGRARGRRARRGRCGRGSAGSACRCRPGSWCRRGSRSAWRRSGGGSMADRWPRPPGRGARPATGGAKEEPGESKGPVLSERSESKGGAATSGTWRSPTAASTASFATARGTAGS